MKGRFATFVLVSTLLVGVLPSVAGTPAHRARRAPSTSATSAPRALSAATEVSAHQRRTAPKRAGGVISNGRDSVEVYDDAAPLTARGNGVHATWTGIQNLASRAVSRLTEQVPVRLYDSNLRVGATLFLPRDGNLDASTDAKVRALFRCRRTGRQREINNGTLAMLADVAARYPGRTIEFVSVYRGFAEESKTSPHRHGRAIDFRVRGVSLPEVRDYLWRTYREVGIGWYPKARFIHMDHRPGESDIAWTELKAKNHYNPWWSEKARLKDPPTVIRRQPGV